MTCYKCGYISKKETLVHGVSLCPFCLLFSPNNKDDFNRYIEEKIDWKVLETFRKYGQTTGSKQRDGMEKVAKTGKVVTRAPLGYTLKDGVLTQNEDASRVHSLFKVFINTNQSFSSLSKQYGLSINGLKKVLKNRTYLGEVKFGGNIYESNHNPIINPEIFYAAQRKLDNITTKKVSNVAN